MWASTNCLSHQEANIWNILKRDGILREPKIPTATAILEKIKNCGCYLDQVPPLNTAMTKEDVETSVMKWFLNVFKYVQTEGFNKELAPSGIPLPWFQLLSQSGTTGTVVEAVYPMGQHLYQHKGRSKASVAESQLWFGMPSIQCCCQVWILIEIQLVTRNRVWEVDYESWNSQPVITGSDLELDEAREVPVASDDDEKLSSELVTLGLDEPLACQRVDVKGKKKAVDINRTPTKTGQSEFFNCKFGLVLRVWDCYRKETLCH